MLYIHAIHHATGYKLMKNTNLFLLVILAIAALAAPVISVHAKGRDPFTTATRTGGSGGGDGDVIFEVHNVNDPSGVVTLQVTETDNNQNQIHAIANTPGNWTNTGLILKNGKAIQTTWQTCVPTTGCAPVTLGGSLSGFDARMNGQAPYGWTWVLTDSGGATFTGNLSVS